MTFGGPSSQRPQVSSRQHGVYFNLNILSKVVRRFHNLITPATVVR